MTSPRYLRQKDGGSCCSLYALCNALRYFGWSSPVPGTREWEKLVDMIGCRHGAAVRTDHVAEHLGLRREPIDGGVFNVPRRLPAMLSVYAPDRYLHVVLVIGAKRERLRLVNYNYRKGPVVEDVAVRDLELPPPHLCKAWALTMDRATESKARRNHASPILSTMC